MTRKTIIAILTGILTQTGFAQHIDKTKLDNYFNALETNNKFMGSVAVSIDGEIIYSKTIGYSDISNKVKANENSKYRIGSISNTYTAVLILKAVEKKKIDFTQSIDKYFPTIKNAEEITIKDLLGHRSGIRDFTNNEDYQIWKTQPKTEKELVEIIAEAGSDFQPGSKAEFSTSNFVLLSYILEKTFKKSYAEILQQYIVKPIGLTNTYLGRKINTNKNECISYRFINDWELESKIYINIGDWESETETDISIPLGAGGIVSTSGDLVKFSDALFGGRLLKSESLKIMKTITNNYGIGLFQFPFCDRICYGHAGSIDGFSSIFSHFSDGNISFALTSNGTRYNTNDISIAVLSAVYGKPYNIPIFKTLEVNSIDSIYGGSEPKQEGKHLFILSGQSNMEGLRSEESFTPVLEAKFGAENIIIVKEAQGGRTIRRWYREWKPLRGDFPKAQPDMYELLMDKVYAAVENEKIETVTLIWMQGESDAIKNQGEVYEASLLGLYDQLSNDLKRNDINFIIGRISDYGIANSKYPQWTMIRDIQVKIAESDPYFDWINTDDLNDGINRKGEKIRNDAHMSADGYVIMGRRFAEKAIQLIELRLLSDEGNFNGPLKPASN